MDETEHNCFIKLQNDILIDFIPKINNKSLKSEDEIYCTEMQDLLYSFNNPFIM
jgi:hypothetical protein